MPMIAKKVMTNNTMYIVQKLHAFSFRAVL